MEIQMNNTHIYKAVVLIGAIVLTGFSYADDDDYLPGEHDHSGEIKEKIYEYKDRASDKMDDIRTKLACKIMPHSKLFTFRSGDTHDSNDPLYSQQYYHTTVCK
jgi:hypothetical protein